MLLRRLCCCCGLCCCGGCLSGRSRCSFSWSPCCRPSSCHLCGAVGGECTDTVDVAKRNFNDLVHFESIDSDGRSSCSEGGRNVLLLLLPAFWASIIFISAIRHFLTDTRLHTDYSKVHILCPSSRLGLDSSDLPGARLPASLRGSRRRLLCAFGLSRCKGVEVESRLAPAATDCPRGLLGDCVQVGQLHGDDARVRPSYGASETTLVSPSNLVLYQVLRNLLAAQARWGRLVRGGGGGGEGHSDWRRTFVS